MTDNTPKTIVRVTLFPCRALEYLQRAAARDGIANPSEATAVRWACLKYATSLGYDPEFPPAPRTAEKEGRA